MRLENARMAAYHAADATPVNPQRLTMIDISRLEALKFALHPPLESFVRLTRSSRSGA